MFLSILKPELDKLTFLDITKRTGVNLVICATHVASMTPVYFSVDTTPNVLVYDALRASIAVPWIMKPVFIGQEAYIDGGITDNIPYSVFETVQPSSVLICHVDLLPSVQNYMTSGWMYTYKVIEKFVSPCQLIKLLTRFYPNVVIFKSPPVPFIPMQFQDDKIIIKLTQKEVEDAIVYGYETIYNKLAGRYLIRQTLQT